MSVASQLTERVRIEQQTGSDDGYGGKTLSWTELATVFAEVTPLYIGQTERAVGEQRRAYAGYRVRMRARSDVTAAMRLVWKTHTLAIHSIHEHEAILSILTYEENL